MVTGRKINKEKHITTVRSEAESIRNHGPPVYRPLSRASYRRPSTTDLTRHFSLDRNRSLIVFKGKSEHIQTL